MTATSRDAFRVDARLTDTAGNGVGRWRLYYDVIDLDDARRASRHLVPKCQVRVREGRTVVVGPCLAEELPARIEATKAFYRMLTP